MRFPGISESFRSTQFCTASICHHSPESCRFPANQHYISPASDEFISYMGFESRECREGRNHENSESRVICAEFERRNPWTAASWLNEAQAERKEERKEVEEGGGNIGRALYVDPIQLCIPRPASSTLDTMALFRRHVNQDLCTSSPSCKGKISPPSLP